MSITEYGFYHIDRGYWQTNSAPSPAILASYPSGTISVPVKPGPYYEWLNGVWVFVEPEPVITVRSPSTIASAKLKIDDLGISGFGVDSAIAGGFRLDTGVFYIYFTSPQPDNDYIVSTFDGGLIRVYVKPEDYFPDGFIITMTDLNDVPIEPNSISIIIVRAQ